MTRCCSSSSTRPRNCGSSRCCTRSRWRCRLVRADDFAQAYKALSRVSRIQAVMTMSWDVLATLTPVDYSAFRHVLGTSSGFQSAQFRELEFRLGHQGSQIPRIPRRRRRRAGAAAARRSPSRQPVGRGQCRARPRRVRHIGRRRDPRLVAGGLSRHRTHFDLYQLAEKLVDIDDALAGWRHKHVLTVERIIGRRPAPAARPARPISNSTLTSAPFPNFGRCAPTCELQAALFAKPVRRARAAAPRRAQPSSVARRQLRRPGRMLGRRRPPRRPQVGPGDGRSVARGAGRGRRRTRHRRSLARSSSPPTPTISSSASPPPARAPTRAAARADQRRRIPFAPAASSRAGPRMAGSSSKPFPPSRATSLERLARRAAITT